MMKRACLSFFFCFCVFSETLYGEPTDRCAETSGPAMDQCRRDQQALRQQQLERMLQEQEQRQNQLDQQQREVQKQLESVRLENEALRKEMRETASHVAQPAARDPSESAEVKNWKAANPWFGSDFAKTQLAMRYAKQLQQERPDLTGRPLLDALSAKIDETFSAKR